MHPCGRSGDHRIVLWAEQHIVDPGEIRVDLLGPGQFTVVIHHAQVVVGHRLVELQLH
jgi:hypothetical protein